jgi:plastocyanin
MMLIRFRMIPAVLASLALVSCGGDSTAPDTTVFSVAVSGTSTISVGGTTQLTATAKNAGGTTLSGLTATWSSSHTDIATVSDAGLVTGVANGTTTITATISTVPGVRIVTVGSVGGFPADAGVEATAVNTFSPPSVDITAGGTITWTFLGGTSAEHNVTFSTSGSPANIGNMASGTAARTFTTAGTYHYTCTNHPGMSGTVVVH